MKKLLRNETGYSIVLVLFILIIISVLSLALLNMSTQSLSLSTHEREDQSIFYIAESGLTYEKEQINDLIKKAYDKTREEFKKDILNKNRQEDDHYIDFYTEEINNAIVSRYTNNGNTSTIKPQIFSSFELQYSHQPKAEIIATIGSMGPLTIDMTSTGYFAENKSNTRTVSQSITVSMDLKFLENIEGEVPPGGDVNLPNLAVQAKNDISLSGSATIHGSAATSEGKVDFSGNTNIVGSIGSNYKPTGPDWLINQNKIMDRHVIPNLTEVNLPTFPTEIMDSLAQLTPLANEIANQETINLTTDAKFSDSIFKRGATTNLNIGDNDINLYVENFITSGYSSINIIGSGKLNIFVKNSFSISGSSSINKDGNASNLNIYYAGSSKVTLGGAISIGGSFFTKESDLNIAGSATVSGNITSGGENVIIDGGSNNLGKYIIAPGAHVKFNQNFNGVVICDTFTASGNSQLKYAPSIVPPPFIPDSQPDYSDPNEDMYEEKDLIEI